jgi:coenzyme F420-dependent glucose-6-phosphate dehydrogenase
MKIGYHCSHEQWPPSKLLTHVQRAEQAGFDAAMCSDHFHPWLEDQGHSGFSWSWLGAAMQATTLSFGTVCAPGQRYHPAVVAQAAATLAEMFPGRFWLSVGSGEALNESITGDPWPAKPQRNRRLKESVDVMRALWLGEVVNHRGLVTVQEAKLYSRPAEPPLVIGAALTEETARWMGSWVDGLITVGKEAADSRKVVDAFRDGGGQGKPVLLQAALSYAKTDGEAARAARREWRQSTLDSQQLADLATPWAFGEAARNARVEQCSNNVRTSSDVNRHIDWLLADREVGFDAVYLHQLGRNIEEFIDVFADKVLPAVRRGP